MHAQIQISLQTQRSQLEIVQAVKIECNLIILKIHDFDAELIIAPTASRSSSSVIDTSSLLCGNHLSAGRVLHITDITE
jgi:hypothetical protein